MKMKIAATVVLFLLMLISSASAGGNHLSQSNSQNAFSPGVFVSQDATNMGIIVGDGNTLNQKNEQDADASGTMSAIFQDASNFGIQVGNGNKLFQTNKADADIRNLFGGSATAMLSQVLIEQTQANLGIQVGDHNNLFQRNDADAEVENVAIANAFDSLDSQSELSTATATAIATLRNVKISQNQENFAVQVGDRNNLLQNNDADAEVENVAVANAGAFASNDATQTPPTFSNVGGIAQDASSDATASAAAGLSHVAIEQNQANLGVQVGDRNSLSQSNDADAEVENVAVANAGAFASNDADLTQTASGLASNVGGIAQDASSDATASAAAGLSHVAIEQNQANLGVQVGDRNSLSQSNDADAEVENVAVANAGAFASNDAKLDQTASGFASNLGGIAQDASSDATASAVAGLSHVAIEQNQANLGVQVGDRNSLFQSNDADAEVENVAVANAGAFASNDADLTQTAYGFARNIGGIAQGASSDATANARSTLRRVEIVQDQTNLGAQVGDRNSLFQSNDADAEVENAAVANAGAIASTNDHVSAVDILDPKVDIESGFATLNEIAIKQCQKNLAVQVGHNFAAQNNYADGQVEQDLANTAANLHRISIEQTEVNAVVQVGSSAVFQNGGQIDHPNQSNTHIKRTQSNTLVEVN